VLSDKKQLIFKATAHAEYIRIKFGIDQRAPIDPVSIAEQSGCEIRYLSLPSLEGMYSPKPHAVIFIGSERPAGRLAFTCMHELGHHEFKHGIRVDEIKNSILSDANDPREFVADVFAANLLMSKTSILYALKTRGLDPQKLEPLDVFRLSSFFGVGYTTIIDHMTSMLRMLNQYQQNLLKKIKAKDLKAQFGGTPQSEVIIADSFWQSRAVDMSVGDILVLHKGAVVEDSRYMIKKDLVDGQPTYIACSRGYTRAFHESGGWAVNIRIAPKQYEGLAQYRFLDDPEEDFAWKK
jgi:Zn-dependent peptidase ImmA (M78 family)